MNTTNLEIDVISDVVCPWCFIGKRRLEAALELWRAEHPGVEPTVRFRPFQLNPQLPSAGMARADYVQQKFGTRGGQVYERVQGVGATLNIPFAFDRIKVQPNTVAAHSLINALEGDAQAKLKEALMVGFFMDGADLSDHEALITLATNAGMDESLARATLANEAARSQVQAQDEEARHMGVEGVPFFVFNKRVAVSGAHEPETLVQAMQQSLKEPS
jgi:predicted DsbA family dithiol-disulfide isomerase